MTKDELTKVRDALSEGCGWSDQILADYDEKYARHPATEADREFITDSQNKIIEALDILDAELAKPEQEPVGCKHNRYSVDVHEQTGTCYDCGAEGRMRFVVDAPAHQMHEPTAPQRVPQLEAKVWEFKRICSAMYQAAGAYDMPVRFLDALSAAANGESFAHLIDGLLPCDPPAGPHARDAVAWMPDTGYVFAPDKNTSPAPAPQRVEYTPNQKIERFNLDVNIDGMDQMREFVLASDHDALVHALEANCDPAGMVQENCLLRDQTRQLGAMIDRLKKEAAPQREWQSLTPDEINDCAGAEIYPSTWGMSFARAIESKLKEKNHG